MYGKLLDHNIVIVCNIKLNTFFLLNYILICLVYIGDDNQVLRIFY